MARGFWKGDCDRFSAVELKDGKIEVLIDGKPWGSIAAHDNNFRFHRHKGLIVLEMLDEIEKYIDSDGEWPDWIGEKKLEGKQYAYSLQKFGHDWERSTGWIKISATVSGLNYRMQFGTLKALGLYCSAVDIESIVDL